MIKKADIILFLVIVIIGSIISFSSVTGKSSGDRVLVSVDGETYGIYELSEDKEIDIDRDDCHNHITIKGGTVQMSSSSCKNQICVNSGAISHAGDRIVCLPNRVVIEIIAGEDSSGKGGEPDVISG